MEKKVTVYSYYSPEEITGIGKYNGEMVNWLNKMGVSVISISNAPFYPYWKLYKGYKNKLYSISREEKLTDIRSYTYIPSRPNSIKKIISEFTFFLTSTVSILLNLNEIKKSNLLIVVNPPFFLGFIPLILKKIFRIRVLFHIQDLQVDAAKELNLLPNYLYSTLEIFEIFLLRNANYISTISSAMANKLQRKGLKKNILIIPNWSSVNMKYSNKEVFWLHEYLALNKELKLIVYSGNIGEKQGLEIILHAARALIENNNLHFVILGEGLFKNKLLNLAQKMELNNLTISGLVPKKNLEDMLKSSFLQLVIQKSEGADSFLPSKVTNILATGTTSIITASEGTGLYNLLSKSNSAKIIKPDSHIALTNAIVELLKNEKERIEIGLCARKWADKNLKIENCLAPLFDIIE